MNNSTLKAIAKNGRTGPNITDRRYSGFHPTFARWIDYYYRLHPAQRETVTLKIETHLKATGR